MSNATTNDVSYYTVMANPGTVKATAHSNVNYILGIDNSNWYLENFMWYYEKKILLDLLSQYGSPIEIVDHVYKDLHNKVGVFEILLYYGFLAENLKKYGYKSYNVTKICEEEIPIGVLENYKFILGDEFKGNFGLLEQTMHFLDESNTEPFANLFKKLKIDILRCECGPKTKQQEIFDDIVKPHIFAASQYHCFGINSITNNNFNVRFWLKEKLKQLMKKCMPAYKVACENRDNINRINMQIANIERNIDELKDNMGTTVKW